MSSVKAVAKQEARGEGAEAGSLMRVVGLLGGNKVLKRHLSSKLDVHEIIVARLPKGALKYVVMRVTMLRQDEVANAVGISVRTIQRLAEAPSALLTKEQSGRTWKFAEVLSKATDVMGSREDAERWLKTPALALEQRRPIDLLTTVAGTELVEQLLGRLEYGVYT